MSPSSPSSALTNVPQETLDVIMGYASDHLKVLSLVNSFFRDTSDLHQFKSVTANSLCDLGAWLALLEARPSVAHTVRDVTITGDSTGDDGYFMTAEEFLTQLPCVRCVQLLVYDLDFSSLSKQPLSTVRHLRIHNGVVSNIWMDLPIAFPFLNSLNIIDYVAPRHRRNFSYCGQQRVGGHYMQHICLESNDQNLVKDCLQALANVDWYCRVTVLEIRSISNVVEMVGESYPAVISRMESLALTSTDYLTSSPSIRLPSSLLDLVDLTINCADDDVQLMQTVFSIEQCPALTHLNVICCLRQESCPVHQWISIAKRLLSDKFPGFKELRILLYPSPMLSPYGDMKLMRSLLLDILTSDQNKFSVFIRVGMGLNDAM
ncbi:hypothetical protein ARMSODRAFT_1027847 [Armillaria solidipes]|uniref:F-box domain-containing protein n=1 Tax=Armillaria solidipes TaxID=1076256 RepID=A0A2H3AJ69_9AGAR|nr:hypothetical protein ARMSODRAFT_1027847 [Armillaria solidipes]